MSTAASNDTPVAFNKAAEVFAVPELLESILLQLDDRDFSDPDDYSTAVMDLFVLMRVNEIFKAAIDSSLKLKRVIILAHDKRDAPERSFGLEYLLCGPLVHHHFDPALPCIEKYQDMGDSGVAANLTWRFQPLDTRDEDERDGYLGCECSIYSDVRYVHRAMAKLTRASLRQHFRPEAFWRRMKLSYKPRKITMKYNVYVQEDQYSEDRLPHVASLGPTDCLGELLDTIQNVLARSEFEHMVIRDKAWGTLMTIESVSRGVQSIQKDEDERLENVEHLHDLKHEHNQKTDCGFARGTCPFCSAVYAMREGLETYPDPNSDSDRRTKKVLAWLDRGGDALAEGDEEVL